MILEISTDNLVDRRQIGWIKYREGNAEIKVKVVRAKDGRPFLSHVNGYLLGVSVNCVEYADREAWAIQSRAMLDIFKKHVGNEHYYKFMPNF